MRLISIEVNGYKRLQNTKCNVDGPTIAFIGPNESGKTSILRALTWLTAEDGGTALAVREQNRNSRPDNETMVVRAFFRVDDDDMKTLAGLQIDPDIAISPRSVTEFRISRKTSGQVVVGLDTTVKRSGKPFARAAAALDRIETARRPILQLLENHGVNDATDAIRDCRAALATDRPGWDGARLTELKAAAEKLSEVLKSARGQDNTTAKWVNFCEAIESALSLIAEAEAAGSLAEPADAIRSALRPRAPQFILFTDEDRELAESYHLGDEALRANPPAPLRNLLTVAGSDVDALWTAVASGDPATMRTLENRMNKTLRQKLEPMWTQSRLTIGLALNQGGVLEINIEELDSPDFTITPINERSDGLRTFLGLVCFLIAANLDVPPVLLIDEAERNLHYDAQADLIRVLTRELDVHKVIYTTHSPGCLPLDLGTGIRVVVRNREDPSTSTLENNFWTNDEPGFSHLLFAMGAQAAAFSAFRRAVLAEGVSEMMLLPTLLRNATDGSQLDFQVAFGLSNMSAPRAMTSVALITTFLVDGDKAGDAKRKQLEQAGVPGGHVFQLPKGKAIEDLIDRASYLATVNELLAESHLSIPSGALPTDVTIAKAVDDYARAHLSLPNGVGHKIIAARLAAQGDGLKLSPAGRRFLKALRADLERAFQQPYTLTQATG